MQQAMNANPVQVVVIAHPGTIDKQIKYRNMKNYLARQLVGLGITQLIIGVLCIIFQGVAVGVFANSSIGIEFFGYGFWNGIMVRNSGMSNIGRFSILRYTDFYANCIVSARLIDRWHS